MPLFFLFVLFLETQRNSAWLTNTIYAIYREVESKNLDYIMVDLDTLVTKLQKQKYIKTSQQNTMGNASVHNQAQCCKQVRATRKR